MRVNFDLNKKVCCFELNGETHELPTRAVSGGTYWECVIARTVDIGVEKYSLSWKVWMGREQFVEIQKYSPSQKLGWQTVASWSFIANPQTGTSQTSAVKHNGNCRGIVNVSGSPFGDWSNRQQAWKWFWKMHVFRTCMMNKCPNILMMTGKMWNGPMNC